MLHKKKFEQIFAFTNIKFRKAVLLEIQNLLSGSCDSFAFILRKKKSTVHFKISISLPLHELSSLWRFILQEAIQFLSDQTNATVFPERAREELHSPIYQHYSFTFADVMNYAGSSEALPNLCIIVDKHCISLNYFVCTGQQCYHRYQEEW